MRLALHILGAEVLALSTTPDEVECECGEVDEQDSPGSCTTMPLGFTPSPGDQRYAEVEVPE